jgi:phenylacetate-CoA ligase
LLDRQLAYVAEHSSFYQRKWGTRAACPTSLDLAGLPFTTRRELQDDQDAHLPFGSYVAAPSARISRVHRTSGSTGRSLLIALSALDVERTIERGGACLGAAGAGPGDLIVHCLNYCLWSGGVTDHQCLERTGAGVIPFGVGRSAELIETMLRLKPTGIHCTPSYLSRLEERLVNDFGKTPRELGLRIGLFGGEPGLQDPRFRSRIEAKWGFRAVDANYGMAEVLSIFGAECDARCGLHFEGCDVVRAEIRRVDGDEAIAFEAGATGELVLTHLQRECQPLVRYRTSDVVDVLATDRCKCGRASPRFRVIGRVDDMIVVRGLNVFPSAIAEVVNTFSDQLSGAYLIDVDRLDPIGRIVVRVEASGPACDSTVGDRLGEAIVDRLGIRVEVEVASVGSLPAGESKTQRVRRIL